MRRCRLAEKSRGGISKDRITAETMLYNATRLFIKANYTEGDSPLLYAEESRLEHDFSDTSEDARARQTTR